MRIGIILHSPQYRISPSRYSTGYPLYTKGTGPLGSTPPLLSETAYTCDTLVNLPYETGNGSHSTDYRFNNLNQEVGRSVDGWKSPTASTYNDRSNLILETYIKNVKSETAGEYTFDKTNKMVEAVNANGGQSVYTYNGLGALMENTRIISKKCTE